MTDKTILINNGNLGRQGKTTIAYTIYKTAIESFKYVTNDIENASIKLADNVKDGELFHFPVGTDIEMDFDGHIIFDFGGKPDDRLLEVADFVDVIIVPIRYESDSELEITVRNINTLIEVNPNIVVVINNTDPADIKLVTAALKFNPAFKNIKIFVINHSKYVRRLANDNNTVFEVASLNKADATRLNKTIIPQFKDLFDHLEIKI
ncbi:MAG: hypothetical protein HRT38_19445 [Alteromonadaceae bacterium]|nr:hypothetical protein [Alteromonadaceae bacterium]